MASKKRIIQDIYKPSQEVIRNQRRQAGGFLGAAKDLPDGEKNIILDQAKQWTGQNAPKAGHFYVQWQLIPLNPPPEPGDGGCGCSCGCGCGCGCGE